MENKPRILTICSSTQGDPQLIIKGEWFYHWGFEHGEQVTLTNPKAGTLNMLVTMSADKWYAQKQVKRLIAEANAIRKELADPRFENENPKSIAKLKEVEQYIRLWEKRA